MIMAEKTMREKLAEVVSIPEGIKRLEQAKERARETIDHIHKAGQLPANWREQRFTI
jgi:hypothetical protein